MKHTNTEVCESCNNKLEESHPEMREWTLALRKRYLDVHVSCTFRNQVDQDQAYLAKASTLRWPHSKHNHTRHGRPYSLAVDLFQIDQFGKGKWDAVFFKKVHRENSAYHQKMRWGGEFKTLGDSCHFELKHA